MLGSVVTCECLSIRLCRRPGPLLPKCSNDIIFLGNVTTDFFEVFSICVFFKLKHILCKLHAHFHKFSFVFKIDES